jgi:hypothetical protein
MSATERRIKLWKVLRLLYRPIAGGPIVSCRVHRCAPFSEAAALLAKTTFTSGEGEDAALGLYRKAHLGLASQISRRGRSCKAAAEFAAVTEFPRNFGVGRPRCSRKAQYYVAAAREYEAGRKAAEAERWWQRAAIEELNAPSQPEEAVV